ncbi:MAG: choice-of-anchor J domain-containing protein [Bacteroidales bacterium]|nr:choice-of-anchor J domain-containing protein [Bacteroidales bacterium]
MRRVFLIISLLCLMPFAMMAQTRDAYNPVVDELEALEEGYAYAFQIFDGPEAAFVKFNLENPSSLNELKHYTGMKITAAEMVPYNSTKDFVYAYATADGISGQFCTVDPMTGELTVVTSDVEPMSEMAYDPTTKTMYGLKYGVLYTINLDNGTATVINEMQTGSNNWVALAINNDGLMYAVNNTFSETNAELYRINPSTWNSTLVGTVPYKTQYAQTMAFDRDNGTLYWWQTSAAGSNLMQVDPTTATCSVLWANNGCQMAGLMFRNQPEKFNITYETVENGAFSGPAQAAANDVVTITVTPEYGYRLGTLTWNGNAIDVEAGEPYTFTMPEEAVTVTGSFLLSLHDITVIDPLNGELATEPADQGLYPNMINVLPTPDPGFGMGTITWVANGEEHTITGEAPYQFAMPDYDVTVSAVYEQTGENTISTAEYIGYFNETVTVAVALANDNYVAGTQMDITLGENLTFVEGSLTHSERAEGEGWNITGSLHDGVLKVTTFNTGLAHYAGNEGTIFTFQVVCAPVISMNPLTFSNVIIGTPDGTQLTVATVNGNVEIKDVVMNQPENVVACHNATVPAIEFTLDESNEDGEASFAWTNDNPTIGIAAEGTGNIAEFTAVNTGNAAAVANITVTPTLTVDGVAHLGTPKTFTITVLPQVVMDPVADLAVCHDGSVNVAFTTTITDGEMTYAWTNDNPAIGLAAEGEGEIAFTAVNETADPLVANISVIPTYAAGELTCAGEAVEFTITVYPNTVMLPVENQTVYSREATEAIFFGANVNDYELKVVFNWTNDNPAIGLAASGTGNIPSFVTAACSTEQVANITVVPTYDGGEQTCEGEGYTFTITVMPTFLVVINEDITNGTLVDNARVSATGEHYAPAGEEITLIATPDPDFFLDYVTVTQLDNNGIVVPFTSEYKFNMPEFDVLCNANFIDANNLSIQPGILDMGYRPINAWMYSKFFDVNNISESDFDVTDIELTNYNFMVLDPITLPFTIAPGNAAQVGLNTNYKNVTPGLYQATMALKGEQNRKAYLRDVVATAYTPVEPDVWELATNVTTFPYVNTQATEGTIYNNYQLPGETTDGYDGVYKIVVDHDVILNASVTGADPKIAIYEQGFKGVGGPHNNNYMGAAEEILSTVQIGEGTTTTNYQPYYTYYKNSICQILFKAEELTAAGLSAGKISSIEFQTNSTNGYTRTLKVWMGNTALTEMTTTSVNVSNMPKVFEGELTQVAGWNKIQFNGANFVWDGTSNVLITITMAHSSYDSSTPWLCTASGFNSVAYRYTDSAPYNADAETYATYVMTDRANIKINGASGMTEGVAMGDEPLVGYGLYPGTYYIVASSTSEDSYTINIDMEDMPLPEPPTVIYPAHESNGIETPVTFEYELGQYTHEYQILLGTSYTQQDVVLDWTSDLSNTFDAGELLHNKVYFWRINERNSTGVTEGPLWIFTTELNMPLNLAVADDELYEGEDAVFTWDTPADRTLRGYNFYQDGVKLNEEPLTENTYTVEGLTYNMDGYDFNVTAVWDEGESNYSNTVTVFVSGYGIVSGHVYEQDGTTGIAGATVTIVGFDEFDELVDFEFTTDENGAYSGNVLVGYWFGMAEKEGYQTVGDNTGFELEYQGTHPNYNFILNEEYTPVTRVVAEEISNDQVHVYWGWDMIEDFESGTLTSYDWVNDTQYPWVLTTNNPYEGTYCIKSSCEGVDYGSSSIEITMMFAQDGLMSFYGKISSEATYDKGQFFIDGATRLTMSGTSDWTFKEYGIGAGMHTLKWSYTKDVSLSSGDDCFYIDYINFWYAAPPVPEGQILVNFESGIPSNWTMIDADGDGYNWGLVSENYPDDGGYNSADAAYSFSWSASTSALEPDNYLVSPEVELGGSVSFWATNHTNSFPEQLGVAISTTGNTNPADFTTIWTSEVDAKGYTPGTRENPAKIGTWHQYTIDLSSYAGQTGYIAIRHYGTYNMWGVLVDDIAIDQPRERAFTNYNVYRKNISTDQAPQLLATGVSEEEYDDNSWGSAAAGVYQWGVSANYAGNRDGESEITWSNKIDKNMTTNVVVNVSTNSNDPATGAVVTLTNTSEPGLELAYNTTLDETGTYTWTDFRKGTYDVTVNLEGFDPLTATATVWEPTTLSYVLNEIIANIDDLYVSTTGWAMFGEIPSVDPPAGAVTVKLTHGDNWGDGSGYQMLLDADATAFGVEIPTSGALTSGCSVSPTLYDVFEYKIPENADPNCSTQNMVVNNTVTITIPAGTYDWCITNPTPGDRIWIAAAQGNVGGRQDDYVFEAGKTYEFVLSMQGSNDAVNVTITDGNKNVYTNTFAPIPADGAKDLADVVTVDNGYVVLPANNRKVEYYNVKLDGIMEGTTELPFFQHNVENLIEGETYTTSVQKVYTTGESEWASFDWIYTACDNYAGMPSEPTAQWSGEDVVLNWTLPGGGDGPTPPPTPAENWSEGFENGIPSTWAIIDADGDGYNWMQSSVMMSGYSITPHSGEDMVSSASYYNSSVLYPDNYLVSPQFTLGGTISFWACAQDASYAAEKFGLAVSTGSQTNPADFTTLHSWTMTAKGGVPTTGITRSEVRATGNYYQYTVDLSAYAGQTGYIAIRHYDCHDQFYLNVDDVEYTASSKGNRSTTYDFETGLSGWTTIDADGNGLNWYHSSNSTSQSGYDYTGLGHNGSNGFAISQSYIDYQGAYQADNYLVSPNMFALQSGSNISFWADYANDSYPDNFGVYVSTAATPTASSFTMVWQGTAKDAGDKTAVRHNGTRYENWRQHTVDLSAYAGQTVWIAFRHNDYDMYEIWIDDVTINAEGGDVPPVDPDDPPTPAADVIGVEIFRDGEWIAEVLAPATTYTDLAVENAEEYTFRVVYDGDQADYMYYRMSCPQTCAVAEDPCKAPKNLAGVYQWNAANNFGALITWNYGDFGAWLMYDDGVTGNFVGENTDAMSFEWANKYHAADLAAYAGTALTKVSFVGYDGSNPQNGIYTIRIYEGGENAPATLVYTQDYNFNAADNGQWIEVTLDTPVAVDATQNLWIALYNDGTVGHLRYPAGYTETGTGDADGRWFNENNDGWYDLTAAGLPIGAWIIRGYVTNAVDGSKPMELAVNNGTANGSTNLSVGGQVVLPQYNFGKSNRDANSFNVYRNGNLIANVENDGSGSYSYFDNVAIGNYEYQVTALYDDCESAYALTPDLTQDYVEVNVTDVNELGNSTKLYPNPTTGTVKIEASGMTHITVMSALGQVLYDANISGDNYELSLNQYNAGLYLVRIAHENGVSVKRVTLVK